MVIGVLGNEGTGIRVCGITGMGGDSLAVTTHSLSSAGSSSILSHSYRHESSSGRKDMEHSATNQTLRKRFENIHLEL